MVLPTTAAGILGEVGALTPRALPSSNLTPATIFRAVEKWGPTLLVDEADTFLGENSELRGILNSGHLRSNAYVLRCVGDSNEPTMFSTWSPKAVATIKRLPDTLVSRSIIIKMRRKTPAQKIDELRPERLEHLEPMKRQAARWVSDNAEALEAADPVLPATVYGRAADNWRVLCAIADQAGGGWGERTREIAERFGSRSEDTLGVLLIEDVYKAFAERPQAGHIVSKDLVEDLVGEEDRPWMEFGRSAKPLTQTQLARLLKPFDIFPLNLRTSPKGNTVAKGYRRGQFEEVFKQYIPGYLPSTPATPLQD